MSPAGVSPIQPESKQKIENNLNQVSWPKRALVRQISEYWMGRKSPMSLFRFYGRFIGQVILLHYVKGTANIVNNKIEAKEREI